jgi:hypothetical protein
MMMTGEVTEIGRLDATTLVLVPLNNKIDLENVIKNNSSLIDTNFKVIMVDNINQVIEHALL